MLELSVHKGVKNTIYISVGIIKYILPHFSLSLSLNSVIEYESTFLIILALSDEDDLNTMKDTVWGSAVSLTHAVTSASFNKSKNSAN
jgi:hypothetical protein